MTSSAVEIRYKLKEATQMAISATENMEAGDTALCLAGVHAAVLEEILDRLEEIERVLPGIN